jgi:hypothetical protein
MVARQSKPNDKVFIAGQVYQYPFRYYYELSDYTKLYRAAASKQVYYGSSDRGPIDAKYFNTLRDDTKTVWYMTAVVSDEENLPLFSAKGYHEKSRTITGSLVLVNAQ